MTEHRHDPRRRRPAAEHPAARGDPRAARLHDGRGRAPGARRSSGRGRRRVDLVLLDIVMPEMDGYEVCRALREDPATRFLPVVMITASGEQEKLAAIEAGADDFIAKPFDQAELLARVRRCCGSSSTTTRSSARPPSWRRGTGSSSSACQEQVEELERLARLRRFLSPQLAELVVSSGDESFLESHRREITVVFCDLRGFTAFAETVEPEDVMEVLGEYHAALGDLVHRFEGTLERFAGDGLMVFFNDPIAVPGRAASGPCGWRSRCAARVAQLARSGGAAATTSASASASPRGTRRSGASGSRGAPTTPPSAA